ncbi:MULTISPECIES: alpha/beta fold hydrolase [unclassified Acinetobacter]|uniref:alpha/beta fold hydrolase n=1 Tax=unclassified Acinetobacter TaxID=196816 RepID=UPI0029342C5F|nr:MULTISPECIES: alpha/beta fold hydrolase [unclassified Acinetobacter]WOE32250.1 alpha/beta fold hydrolase [Acinetobacter sp. SAAs470]WOE37720.1 alpha/beta fold hydrolase [Acinetobacter sp. SAAs474]
MQLNYEYQKNEKSSENIILIHGLFGSLSNLGMLAREFSKKYNVIQVDVRNHGKSNHSPEMNYRLMAEDIIETLRSLNIEQSIVIGHSMGGKIAMTLAALIPKKIKKLIVLDIAPYAYKENHHNQIFKALFSVKNAQVKSRQEAIEIMKNDINEDMVIQFLLKSFSRDHWLFNVDALYENYSNILSWDAMHTNVETLFIRGGNSPYIQKQEYITAIQQQFNNSTLKTVHNAGHWLHAEQTTEVIALIKDFIEE